MSRDHTRQVCRWRDLSEDFGPWQTMWKRHHRWSVDGTYDAMLAAVADVFGLDLDELDGEIGKVLSVSKPGESACGRCEPPLSQGVSKYKKSVDQPADHALGRSPGRFTAKIHALTDLTCSPVTTLLNGG